MILKRVICKISVLTSHIFNKLIFLIDSDEVIFLDVQILAYLKRNLMIIITKVLLRSRKHI